MKTCSHCDSSINCVGDDENCTTCGDFQFYCLGDERRSKSSYYCSHVIASSLPQLRCPLGQSKNNRVRFSSVLVTSVETRPRTLTEEKPNLYWTANEIASLRYEQFTEECVDNSGEIPSGKDYKGVEDEEDHEIFLRSRHLEDNCCNHFTDVSDHGRQHHDDYYYESGSSPTMVVPFDEECGPHLLSPSLDCEWVQ